MFQLDFFFFFFFFYTLPWSTPLSKALVMEVWGARTKLSIWWIICRCLPFGTIHVFWIIKLKRKKDRELRFYSKVSVTILFMLLNALDCLPVKETLNKIFCIEDCISPSSLLSNGPPAQNKFRNCFAAILMSTIIVSFIIKGSVWRLV